MKWNGNYCFLIGVLCLLNSCNYLTENDCSSCIDRPIIPKPQSITRQEGCLTISNKSKIIALKKYKNEAFYLKKIIDSNSIFNIDVILKEGIDLKYPEHSILLFNHLDSLNNEEYYLEVNQSSILILSNDNELIMNGIQSLRQLFNNDFHKSNKQLYWQIPFLKIKDQPKFKHRGLLLDCSRHFFTIETIKKYIDLLALYKMNVLHWHLTDDQGWRIEINKYPQLTKIGASRKELNGEIYGGYYTQDEIKDIVAFAAERHVTIIPEIELPGHSQAAIAAYPYLSCMNDSVDVVNDWGVFKEIYCAGNDSTFIFLENVLAEVIDLFPSKYIHIGGDEVPKFRWEHCEKCQNKILELGIKDEHQLQSYFITRIEKFLNQKGRKMIGWDEILEGGLSPNATVQSWRGFEGGLEAAKMNHQAIMSPTSHAYFDYPLKAIDLRKVYDFNPIPENLPENKMKFIIGGECNMWTEHVHTEMELDKKVFPRLLAMSEVLWSYPASRNYDDFYNRIQHQYKLLQAYNVQFGEENTPAKISTELKNNRINIIPLPGYKDLDLQYYWSDSINSRLIKIEVDSLLTLTKSGVFHIQAYKNNTEYGNLVNQEFKYHKGLGHVISYNTKYNDWYTAGGKNGLVDGRRGSLDFRDGNWQGFWEDDIEVVIDLNKNDSVHTIETQFYQYNNSWIFMPENVTVEGSIDGVNYFILGEKKCSIDPKQRGKFKESINISFETQTIRYIRLKAKNIQIVPDWHEAAGAKAWLFIDEISIE